MVVTNRDNIDSVDKAHLADVSRSAGANSDKGGANAVKLHCEIGNGLRPGLSARCGLSGESGGGNPGGSGGGKKVSTWHIVHLAENVTAPR